MCDCSRYHRITINKATENKIVKSMRHCVSSWLSESYLWLIDLTLHTGLSITGGRVE